MGMSWDYFHGIEWIFIKVERICGSNGLLEVNGGFVRWENHRTNKLWDLMVV